MAQAFATHGPQHRGQTAGAVGGNRWYRNLQSGPVPDFDEVPTGTGTAQVWSTGANSVAAEEVRLMDIVRNPDGTLIVPVAPERAHPTADASESSPGGTGVDPAQSDRSPATRLLHPGEGGYDEALAEWDLEQNPDRAPVVSTASGRQEAMALVHTLAISPDQAVAAAVEALDDPLATGEALRHILVGGVHSVEAFATEVAEAEGGEPLSSHETTRIIGEVLTELD